MDEYSNAEIQESSFNFKALNAIANEVDINQHDLISTCTIAKEAQEILWREGDNTVKHSKFEKLATTFEILKMHEHEEILDFNAKLLMIASTSYSLSKRISYEELVKKFWDPCQIDFLSKL